MSWQFDVSMRYFCSMIVRNDARSDVGNIESFLSKENVPMNTARLHSHDGNAELMFPLYSTVDCCKQFSFFQPLIAQNI